MTFALLPFIPYHTSSLSGITWQISSALFALWNLSLVWHVNANVRNLPASASTQLSKGWMVTYQGGSILMAILLLVNALSLTGNPGPALYLTGLGWQLFMAASLFIRLLLAPGTKSQ